MNLRIPGHRGALALVVGVVALVAVPAAAADQGTSEIRRIPAALLSVDSYQSCAILTQGRLRCWGEGGDGRLGYGNENDIGDTELPDSAGPVALGTGLRVLAIAAGDTHTCAIVNAGAVRCWGYGGDGALGYANINSIGDNELPNTVGEVFLGTGRTAVAVSAGERHTCAILDNGTVRCWGDGSNGQLGYGNTTAVGDNERPGDVGTVFLGNGRKARAISAGGVHTCAILDNGRVLCWGDSALGQLGYGNVNDVGDTETPGSVAPVSLGRRAVAISAGQYLTCALLDNGEARCWGSGATGQLGLGNIANVGDNEVPSSVPTISLGRLAVAISAGYDFACAILANGAVKCWGYGGNGELGYGNTDDVGDNEFPHSVGTVRLGPGRTARAIATGWEHTCVVLDNGQIRCWGQALHGQLGYGNTTMIGDTETPDTVGPVSAGGLVPIRVRPAISFKVTPRHDRSARYRLRAAGKLTGFIADTATCSGKVRVQATQGGAAVSKRVELKPKVDGCAFEARLTVGSGRWKITAKFPGNGSLRERRSGAKTFRAG